MTIHAAAGRLDWIGLRPARREAMTAAGTAEVTFSGLVGDRHPSPGKRAVTLIQAEHLPVIAALSGATEVTPERLRRNLVVSGINLSALRGATIEIGPTSLQITGACAPCWRMETEVGAGGYNAMRGHGGWTAEVLTEGQIQVGDLVKPVSVDRAEKTNLKT